jgi:hypothetical protein
MAGVVTGVDAEQATVPMRWAGPAKLSSLVL